MHIDPSSPIPIYLQIEQLIEQLILKKDLATNELLPSISVLAKQLKVRPLTVQKAFKNLRDRGLIYSIAGRGTFVADAGNQQFVGVLVHNQFIIEAAQTPTPALLVQAITRELARQKFPVRLLMDTCPHVRGGGPISADIMSTLEHGRPMGLILIGHAGSDALVSYIQSRNIPTVGVHTKFAHATTEVRFDHSNLIAHGLTHMHREGIDTVGLMWLDANNSPHARKEQCEYFRNIFAEHGADLNPDWLIGVHQPTDWAGYHAFNHLCELPKRPRGLIVLDDVIGRGVHMAVLARQLSVPRDLTIVVHKNEDSPINFPSEWQQVGYNLQECGSLAVNILQKALAGDAPARDAFPIHWQNPLDSCRWTLDRNKPGTDLTGQRLFRSGRQALETIS